MAPKHLGANSGEGLWQTGTEVEFLKTGDAIDRQEGRIWMNGSRQMKDWSGKDLCSECAKKHL
jgi:hypothetical protein